MKASTITLVFLIDSLLLAIFSTIFIHPLTASGLVCTAMIFRSYKKIKYREELENNSHLTKQTNQQGSCDITYCVSDADRQDKVKTGDTNNQQIKKDSSDGSNTNYLETRNTKEEGKKQEHMPVCVDIQSADIINKGWGKPYGY